MDHNALSQRLDSRLANRADLEALMDVRDFYLTHRQLWDRLAARGSAPSRVVDPVSRATVGRFNVTRAVRDIPEYLKPTLLRYLRGLQDDGVESPYPDPVFTNFITEAEFQRRGGLSPDGLPEEELSRAAADGITGLRDSAGLYAEVSASAPPATREFRFATDSGPDVVRPATASANFFLVPKGNDRWRVICDARMANRFMNKDNLPLRLFSLDDLLDTMRTHSQHFPNFTTISCDLRHWFHQLNLPVRYRRLFGMHLPAGKGTPGKIHVPTAVPMGWTLAPALAQAATLSILLRRESNANADALAIDEAALTALMGDNHELPPYIPLRDGAGNHGRVYVLLDNILVVTHDAALADRWKRHIKSSCGVLNVELKEEEVAGAKVAIRSTTLQRNCGGRLRFLGIDWEHGRRRVAVDPREEDPLVDWTSGSEWTGRRRLLATILGRLLWVLRVQQEPFCEPRRAALMEVFSRNSPRAVRHEDWNSAITIDASTMTLISSFWRHRNLLKAPDAPFDELGPRQPLPPRDQILMAATDATGGGALAAVIYGNNTGEVHEVQMWPSELKPEPSAQQVPVHLLELEAVVRLIQHRPAPAYLLAIDSANVTSWLRSWYARNRQANALLWKIRAQVALVWGGWVGTDDNVADVPTRAGAAYAAHPHWARRRDATWVLLDQWEREWRAESPPPPGSRQRDE